MPWNFLWTSSETFRVSCHATNRNLAQVTHVPRGLSNVLLASLIHIILVCPMDVYMFMISHYFLGKTHDWNLIEILGTHIPYWKPSYWKPKYEKNILEYDTHDGSLIFKLGKHHPIYIYIYWVSHVNLPSRKKKIYENTTSMDWFCWENLPEIMLVSTFLPFFTLFTMGFPVSFHQNNMFSDPRRTAHWGRCRASLASGEKHHGMTTK